MLLTDVAYFEWRVLDGRSMEWQYDWEIQGRLPLQLELIMAIGAKGEEIRQIFWVPPKQNPEVIMRQMLQGGGARPSTGASPAATPAAGGNRSRQRRRRMSRSESPWQTGWRPAAGRRHR